MSSGRFLGSIWSATKLRLRDPVIAVLTTVVASEMVHTEELIQNWIMGVLIVPDDMEVVMDRAISSTVRMFSIATGADIDALFSEWKGA